MFKNSRYSRAFWVLLFLFFINRMSAALIWPFLSLYIHEQLNIPLAAVGSLLSLQAFSGLLGSSVIGVIMDRFGRKRAMAIGLLAWSAVLIGMSLSTQIWQWAVLLCLYGVFQSAFYIGSFAMIADIVQPEDRTSAYAVTRTFTNLAIAVGPLVGAFFTALSISFYHATAVISVLLVVPFVLLIRETMPEKQEASASATALGGYRFMLKDKPFLAFFGSYLTLELAITLVFTLLPVYVKDNFAIPKEQYSAILSVNALMIVFFQVIVSRVTSRYRALPMLVLGCAFYVMGLLSFAFSSALLHFGISMAVMTIGELIVAPTSSSFVANLAPINMRARYMGLFSVAYTISSGIGPVIGGILSDNIAPVAIWYGGAVAAFCGLLGFVAMMRARIATSPENMPAPVSPPA